jgi:hypothetical protein
VLVGSGCLTTVPNHRIRSTLSSLRRISLLWPFANYIEYLTKG